MATTFPARAQRKGRSPAAPADGLAGLDLAGATVAGAAGSGAGRAGALRLQSGAAGRRRELLCLPRDLLPGGLFGITPGKA